MKLRFAANHSTGTAIAGWDVFIATTAGVLIADLTDQDTSSPSGVALEVVTPFAADTSGNYVTGTHHTWPEDVWDRINYSRSENSDPAAVIRLSGSGLTPGNSYLFKSAGAFNADNDVAFDVNGVSDVYDNIAGTFPITPTAPVEITAVATDDGSGNGVLTLTIGYAAGSNRNYFSGSTVEDVPSGPPTISNVDGDNAVNQGQLVNIDVSNFTETITSGDINGVAFPSIPDNDPTDDVIQVRIPVTLADGTYDVTISGATETDTISGVTYTVTHPYEAPYGQVDSNSDWQGQKLTEDTYWRVITPFAHGTYDFVAGAAETPPFGNDINDHFTAEAGYEGPDSEVREVMYADGTTAQYTVNIEISDGTAEVDWPFSKQIRYAATKNWTWGSRHPKTGMRVRIFK